MKLRQADRDKYNMTSCICGTKKWGYIRDVESRMVATRDRRKEKLGGMGTGRSICIVI
jgi:hypothetical protein